MLYQVEGNVEGTDGGKTSGDVEVHFQRRECSKFVGIEASLTKYVLSSNLD